MKKRFLCLIIVIGLLVACGPNAEDIESTARAVLDQEATATAEALPTNTPLPTKTSLPTETPTSTPIPYDLTVTVLGAEGQALESAQVTLSEADEDTQTATNSGQVSWENLPDETATLSVYSQGYLPLETNAALERGSNEVEVTLERDPAGLLPSEIIGEGQELLFVEDFQDSLDDFTDLYGSWLVIEDPITVGNIIFEADNAAKIPTFASFGPSNLKDFIVEYDFRFLNVNPAKETHQVNLTLRKDYWVSASPFWTVFEIYDISENPWEQLYYIHKPYQNDIWYRARIEAIGSDIRIYLDGNLYMTVKDARRPNTAPKLNFGVGDNTLVHFDNIVIIKPKQ